MLGDEIWDENQWEAYLRASERRMDRYMEVLLDFLADNPRPDSGDPEALAAWRAALRAFIARKGWKEDDLPPLLFLDNEPDPEETGWSIELDEAFLDEEEPLDDFDSFRRLPIYQHSMMLASDVLRWTDALPGEIKDSALVQYCANLMQIPAKVAKGHALGYDKEMIGGNIACVKRALGYANKALELLREMKERPYMDAPRYRRFYEETYEVRNALGLYTQELRERFNLGID